MATTGNYSTNIALPALPKVADPMLFQELLQLYNAVRTVAVSLDNYTNEGKAISEVEIIALQLIAQTTELRREIFNLKEQLETPNTVNWGQPGELGNITPNSAVFTKLTVEGNSQLASTTVSTFGANGVPASNKIELPAAATDAASTQALVNALRSALITFGLGV